MKRALVLITLAALATPALAQNPSQIAAVQRGASCPGCNLFQADLSSKELKGKNLSGARLRQADLSIAVINNTDFSRGDLRDVNAYATVFTNANFAGANMENASFVGAYLEGAKFGGATLTGVNFSGAEMDRASGLTQAQLNKACGDASTKLPRGLRIPDCK
ncbi:MAG: pentapeptide repeat-containing protein [Alphaproteobacteria bacterium]